MRAALKRLVVPALRERGFRGELPHLRRVSADATHTFTVQTSKWGGEFIVELGRAAAGPYRTSTGEVIEPAQLTSWNMRDADRARLRAVPDTSHETWFRYAPRTRDRAAAWLARLLGRPAPADGFERAARQLLSLLPECDRWWSGENRLPHIRSFTEQLEDQGGPAPRPPLHTTASE